MKTLIILIVFTLLGSFVWLLVADNGSSQSTEIGLSQSPLRDIKLTDQDNQPFTLGDLHGKTVILNFMFNGCSPVQTVGLRRSYLDHKLDSEDKNIMFLSISVATETDTPEQLKRFAQRYGIYSKNWRIAITDKTSLDALLETFNAGVPPAEGQIGHLNTIFLINEKGLLTKRYIGYPVSPSLVFDDLSKTLLPVQNI